MSPGALQPFRASLEGLAHTNRLPVFRVPGVKNHGVCQSQVNIFVAHVLDAQNGLHHKSNLNMMQVYAQRSQASAQAQADLFLDDTAFPARRHVLQTILGLLPLAMQLGAHAEVSLAVNSIYCCVLAQQVRDHAIRGYILWAGS